jgi:hypothetical protein
MKLSNYHWDSRSGKTCIYNIALSSSAGLGFMIQYSFQKHPKSLPNLMKFITNGKMIKQN